MKNRDRRNLILRVASSFCVNAARVPAGAATYKDRKGEWAITVTDITQSVDAAFILKGVAKSRQTAVGYEATLTQHHGSNYIRIQKWGPTKQWGGVGETAVSNAIKEALTYNHSFVNTLIGKLFPRAPEPVETRQPYRGQYQVVDLPTFRTAVQPREIGKSHFPFSASVAGVTPPTDSPEEAEQDGEQAIENFTRQDPMGNMGAIVALIRWDDSGKWSAAVVRFHSDT